MKYFAIEREDKFFGKMMLADKDGNPAFTEFLDMNYDEMKSSEYLTDFIVAAMDAANKRCNSADKETSVTLIGEDDVFIWGIIMGPGDNDDIRYCLVDWKKDGKNYRYGV